MLNTSYIQLKSMEWFLDPITFHFVDKNSCKNIFSGFQRRKTHTANLKLHEGEAEFLFLGELYLEALSTTDFLQITKPQKQKC